MCAWTNEKINVLGVDIVHCQQKILKLNYQPIINKMNVVLNAWGNRNLSLFGKILIVNTLIASLFVYNMSVLPRISESMIEKINKMVESFLWNGRKPKVKLSILQANKSEGGAGLVNFGIKDDSLKIAWVQILETDSVISSMAYRKLSNN